MKLAHILGSIFGSLIVALAISALIFFGFNYVSADYGGPLIKEFWHVFVAWELIYIVITFIFRKGK